MFYLIVLDNKFTAYGPRENETPAMIAKAFIRMDPYMIWGTGEQDRNFTYVQDIVDALIIAAEKIENRSPVNAGKEDRITLNQATELIFDIIGWRPKKDHARSEQTLRSGYYGS